MGVITVEVPMPIDEDYTIESRLKAKKLIDSLRELGVKKKRRDLSDVVGIWADRKESAEEIARELRRKSNMMNNG